MSKQVKYTTAALNKRVQLRKIASRIRAEQVRDGIKKPSKKHTGNGAFGTSFFYSYV